MPTPRPPVGGSEVSPSERISFQGNPVRGPAGRSRKEHTMASVRIEQRAAHLAGPVRLDTVYGREGPVARATLTAISNTRRGRGEGEQREEEATAIQWTLWGKQAENAAQYLGKGSHVNIVGRMRNNNYEKDGQTVYGMAFTAEEIDYLDSRADAQARRESGQGGEASGSTGATQRPAALASRRPRPARQPAGADA
jgi:single-strand DNA-binding protein